MIRIGVYISVFLSFSILNRLIFGVPLTNGNSRLNNLINEIFHIPYGGSKTAVFSALERPLISRVPPEQEALHNNDNVRIWST